jgi:hypothetical protein
MAWRQLIESRESRRVRMEEIVSGILGKARKFQKG